MKALPSHNKNNSSSNDPAQQLQQQQLIVETAASITVAEGAAPSSIGDDDDARAIPPSPTSNERSGDDGSTIPAQNEVEPSNGQGLEHMDDSGTEKGGTDGSSMQKVSGKSEEGLWSEMEETAVSVNSRLSSLSSSTPAPNLAANVGEDSTTATMAFGSLLEAKAAIAAANVSAPNQPLEGQGTIATNHVVAALPMEATLVEAKTAIAAAAASAAVASSAAASSATATTTKTGDKQESPEDDDGMAAPQDATVTIRRPLVATRPGATSIVPFSDSATSGIIPPRHELPFNDDNDYDATLAAAAAVDTTTAHYAVSAYTVQSGGTSGSSTTTIGTGTATRTTAVGTSGSNSVDSERTRFRQQVRDSLAAQAVQAVEAQPIQSQDSHSDEHIDATHPKRQRRKVLSVLTLVVIGIAVVAVAVPVATTRRSSTIPPPTAVSANPPSSSTPVILLPDGRRAFTETSQLYQAVDDYDVATRGGANGTSAEFSAVATMYGYPMGTWDVSRLTDFARVFVVERAFPWPNLQRRESVKPLRTMVIPDLSGWNVSQATTMQGMFAGAVAFTGEGLADWDVGLVVDFSLCFAFAAELAADLSQWNTTSAFNMSAMFYEAISFNGDLSSWNVSKVQSTARMFVGATSFQGTAGDGLSRWNVAQLKDMSGMFLRATIFNGNVSTWDTRNVEHMANMFDSAKAFTGDVSRWRVDKVQILDGIFAYASSFAGGDLTAWNTSLATSLSGAFAGCDVFTGEISTWDVGRVSDFSVVFPSCPKFDGDLSKWNTAAATDMTQMLRDAHAFSGDVSSWNTSKVLYMGQMFQNARSFNGNISRWNVASVVDASGMFAGALAFNQSLCEWRRTLPVDVVVDDMFDGTDCDSTASPTLFTTQEGTPSWFGPFCSACRI